MAPIQKQCQSCLRWVPSPARKCGFCGEWIEGEDAPAPLPVPPAQSHRWIIVLIVLIVLGYGAIYAVQMVFMWNFMKHPSTFFDRFDDRRKPVQIEDDLVVPLEEDD